MWELDYKESWAPKNWCFCFFVCLFLFFYFLILTRSGGSMATGATHHQGTHTRRRSEVSGASRLLPPLCWANGELRQSSSLQFPPAFRGQATPPTWPEIRHRSPNWCFWTLVLEKTLESPLDSKEIQTVHPKGNQPWIFIGRTDAETEAPILWPPDVKSWLTGKDPDAGKDWGQEEKGVTEDEMVVWHHWLNGHEFE